MFTEDKVTEIFCIADDFCKLYDAMMAKYTVKSPNKRPYHRDGTLSKAEVMLIMIDHDPVSWFWVSLSEALLPGACVKASPASVPRAGILQQVC